MFGLGFGELILIFIIALIFIGPKKLPELAKGLGQGLREFQKAAKGLTEQLNETAQDKGTGQGTSTDTPQIEATADQLPADQSSKVVETEVPPSIEKSEKGS